MAVDEVVAVIAEHAARGVPVLFSSHQLEVVERLCDDLVIIADGKVLEDKKCPRSC
jgi:ABC-2 type transport system ATP-binding protein